MGYELLVRSAAPDAPLSLDALVARLQQAAVEGIPQQQAQAAQGASPAPSAPEPAAPADAPAPAPAPASAGGPWTLRNGKARVEAKLSFKEGGVLRGADVEVPFGGTPEEFTRALGFALGLAADLGGTLYDPQLAREIGKGGEESVLARWRESQAWMVDTVGVAEDHRSLGDLVEPPPLINSRNKVLLGIFGVLVTLYLIWSAFVSATLDKMPIPKAPPGPPGVRIPMPPGSPPPAPPGP